ncbi:MAG: hypothetical protein IJF43_05500 [Firmicutes bacterium]|nr:hypothetical protein [Bacillota bacterium]
MGMIILFLTFIVFLLFPVIFLGLFFRNISAYCRMKKENKEFPGFYSKAKMNRTLVIAILFGAVFAVFIVVGVWFWVLMSQGIVYM